MMTLMLINEEMKKWLIVWNDDIESSSINNEKK